MAASSIKEPVRIRRKTLANGNVSLYLAIYINGRREYEFLKLYLVPEKTRADKERNKQTLALAGSIKAQRIVDIQRGAHGFKEDSREDTLFYDYYNALSEKRKKKESSGNFGNWASCLRHLMKYDPRQSLTFADITPKWVQGFRDYLENSAEAFGCDRRVRRERRPLSQNSKHSYFNKLRTCLRQAYEDGIIRTNPMRGISGFSTREGTREYLTLEEVRAMAGTDCDYPEIKRAFLFACLTGLRRSDVEKLSWGDVTELNGRTRLVFRQKKTGGQEYLDITAQAAELIGVRGNAKAADRVFGDIRFPAETNNSLRIWALRAGIDKHISFHVARHTFAVMMLTLGTDIYTVSKLLGHRELRTTQIYAKIVDAKKQEAVDNIPKIF
ncbi:site-specific integrase [Muribaculum intestinale]|uniref:site-specific integrase n=1 Tax=Muribaculum intestinale TaxID=1796646 RepID=UPI002433331C|nr:site-specific integrase [Muribaculum intestinale]